MKKIVLEYFDKADIYISTAAMSDIEFNISKEKIKKSSMSNNLEFSKAPDVLATVLKKKKEQIIIGFAAETSSANEAFLEKWKRKPVDLLIGNVVNSGVTGDKKGFRASSNEYFFIKDGKVSLPKHLSKSDLASEIQKEVF